MFSDRGNNDAVCAFASYQDPTENEPTLYAVGEFTDWDDPNLPEGPEYVARWNGQCWEEVDLHNPNRPQDAIYALAVFPSDDDPNRALYAGGDGGIYQWKASTWSRVVDAPSGVHALVVYTEPSDPNEPADPPCLYAGGNASGSYFLQKWSGDPNDPWVDLPNIEGTTYAMQVHFDGSHSSLYVGGWHPYGSEQHKQRHLARWDGAWRVDSDIEYPEDRPGFGTMDHVYALASFSDWLGDDSGPERYDALYAGGHFRTVGSYNPADTDSEFIGRAGFITMCRGDLNFDGEVGFGDINPFTLALSNPSAYAVAYAENLDPNEAHPHPALAEVGEDGEYSGGLVRYLADLNCDTEIDFEDLNPFVLLLSNPAAYAQLYPECQHCVEIEALMGSESRSESPSAEDVAITLAENVAPELHDSLVEIVATLAEEEEAEEKEAYWQVVYETLKKSD